MSRRLVGVAAASFIAVLALTVGATAAPATHASYPVSFVLTPAICSQLTTTVTGNGTADEVSHASVNGQGVVHFVLNTTIDGTATDTAGGSYRFDYHNSTKVDVAPTDFPTDEFVTDHFNLVGNGSANQLHTHFVLRIHIASPTDITFEFVSVHGDPLNCDPI